MDRLIRFLLENSNGALLVLDSTGRLLGGSPKACDLLGYSREELPHRKIEQLLTTETRGALAQALSHLTADEGDGVSLAARCHNGAMVRLDMNALRVESGGEEWVVLRLHQPSEAIREDALSTASVAEGLDRDALNRAMSNVGAARNVAEMIERIEDGLEKELGFVSCAIELLDEFTGRLRTFTSRKGPERMPHFVDGPGLLARAVRTGQVINEPNVRAHQGDLSARSSTQSELIVPLKVEGKVIGALSLVSPKPDAFSERDVGIVTTLADRAAKAICQIESYQRLQESEAMYRSLLENSTEGIFRTTPGDRFLAANPALARMLGYDNPSDLLKLDVARDLWVDGEACQEYKREMERQGRVVDFEIRLKKADGSVIIVKENARAVRDAQGQVLYYEGSMVDVTERKRAEKELHQRNQELSTLYTIAMAISRDPSVASILHNSLSELTRVLDVPFGTIYIKQEEKLILQSYRGFSEEEVQRLKEFDPTRHPWVSEVEDMREPIHELVGDAEPWEKERGIQSWVAVPMRSKKKVVGLIRLASTQKHYFTPATIPIIAGVANQVAMALENARLYDQIKASEEKYRSIFENVVLGLYQTSPEGRVLTANPALVRMLGYESLEELLAADITHEIYISPEDRENNLDILHRTGRLEGVEYSLRRKDGREIIVLDHSRAVRDAAGQVRYYEGTLIDITEKKALEHQLLQAQKMESIGTLAGGIAHDFNNLLTGILGYTSLMLSQSGPADRHYRQLLIIEESARRAAELTEQLLAFSRQTMTQRQPTDLNTVLDETMALLRGSLDASIEIEVRKEPALWTVEADARRIQQVLMNLCVNARDAMPNGGLLRIETANVVLDEEAARGHVDARPGQFVVLRIRDNGEGIAAEDLPRIFDPFFSTKEVKEGTGLGLSMAYGIVKSHDGFIQVESDPSQGTRFSIYLPAVKTAITTQAQESSHSREGRTMVLVVDDEEIVRRLAKAILEREGFRVVTAAGGHEALKIYREQRDEISLVILDLTMPKMSGRVCYQELRKLDPQVNVLLSSGYTADDAVQDLLDEGVIKFLQKPYRVEDLTRAVSEVLDHK